MLNAIKTSQPAPAAQLAMRNQFNHVATPHDQRPLYQQFVERLAQPGQAQQTAVIAGDGLLSHQDLCAQSSRLGAYLSQQVAGAEPPIVAILLPKGQLQVVSVWGIVAAGAAYLPLDTAQPLARLHAILQDARPSVVIVNDQTQDLVADLKGVQVLNLSEQAALLTQGALPSPQSLPGHHAGLTDLAYVIYTSGTTGQPKGVMIEWAGVLNAIAYSRASLFSASAPLVLLGVSALHHDMSVFDVLGVMVCGGTLVLPPEAERKNPEAWARLINQHAVTGWVSVPAMMEMLLTWSEYKAYRFDSLRTVLLGGDWLPLPLPDRIRALCAAEVTLFSVGGPTETTMWNIAHQIEGQEAGWASVPYGRPLSHCGYHILDESLLDVPDWVVGELYCSGVSLARGYLNDAARTAERFIVHPVSGERLYRSGDLGFYHPDGRIEFVGRQDGQLKVRGNRIEAGEVRAHLEGWPEVSRAVVYLSDGQQLVAALLLRPGVAKLSQDELYARAKGQLAEAMIPSLWLQLSELPLTGNGKVDMKALLALAQTTTTEVEDAPDRGLNETEVRLAALWAELLGQGPDQGDGHFFALGGDSLLLIRLLSRIQAEFKVGVTLPDLLTHLTLSEQAELVARKAAPVSPAAMATGPLSVSAQQSLPLSSSQRGFWFQMALDASADQTKYTIALCFAVTGELDVLRLQQAVAVLLQRHRLLRSRIVLSADGDPCLQVAAHTIGLRFTDLSGLTDEVAQQRLRQCQQAELTQAINIQQDPLFNIHLIRLSDQAHQLHLRVHHIIFDGVSCDVLLRELLAIYHHKNLAPLSVDYVDYIQWEQSAAQQAHLQSGMAYWQRRLHGMAPLTLPHLAAEADAAANGSRFCQIDSATVDALKTFAGQHQSTLFTAFALALQLVLARFKNDGDVAFGTYVSNRGNRTFAQSIGNFINLLTLRFDFDLNATVAEAMARSHRQIAEDFAWQQVPFEAVVEACNPDRAVGRHPFFDVSLVFNDGVLQAGYQDEGIDLSLLIGVDRGMASHRTDIEFWLYPTPEGLLCEVNYAQQKVGDHLVEAMLQGFKHVLTAMTTAAPQSVLSSLPLYAHGSALSVAQGDALEFDDQPISAILAHKAETHPEQIVYTDAGVDYTYAQLSRRSQALAAALLAKGVRAEDRVGILLPYGIELIIASLAALRVGGTLLLLDTIDSTERMGTLLRQAEATLVITDDAHMASLPSDQSRFSLSSFDFEGAHEAVPIAETDRVYLVYTSGSTGASKAVVGRRFGLLNRIYWAERQYPSHPSDVGMLKTSVSFVDIYAELFTPIVLGCRAVIAEDDVRKDPAALVDYVSQQQVTHITLTPTLLLEMCTALTRRQAVLTSLQQIIISGELLFSQLTQRARACMPRARLINIYGASEMSADIMAYEVTGAEDGLIPAGTLLSHASARIVNADGWILPKGCMGELYCGGPVLAHGYALACAEQAQRFFIEQGQYWFKTGDYGFINDEGQMVVLGRRDDQVKIRGVRIDLRAIDRVVSACAGVSAACSATVVAHNGDLVLGVLVVMAAGVTQAQIYAELRDVLPRSSMPSMMVAVADMPKLSGGKVDRRAVATLLADNYAVTQGLQAGDVLPRTVIEQKIASLWRSLLGIEADIGIHQNFFMLGGHSVLATRLLNGLKTEFKVALALVDMFQAPTIAQQAELVEALPEAQALAWTVVDRAGHHPLSDNQLGAWYTHKTSRQHDLSNHLALMYDVKGALDPQRLQQALNQLVMRHEALRTAFEVVGTQPLKKINPFGFIGLAYKECDDVMAESLIEHNRLMAQPFDLSNPPLVRIMLLTQKTGVGEAGHSMLVLVAHHMIMDAWSLQVFFRDLSRLYHGEVLEPLAYQGVDYHYLKHHHPSLMAESERLQAFWQNHLAGMPPCLNLPVDAPRAPQQTRSGRTLFMDVPDALLQGIGQLAMAHQVGAYHVFISGLIMTLSLWCDEQDVVIGGGVAGRHHQALEGVIDFFSDVVPFRGQLAAQGTLSSHLAQLLVAVSESLAHQQHSFTQIAQQLNHPRSPLYHPVVQVICTHQNLVEDLYFDDAALALFIHQAPTPKTVRFDLSLFLFEHNQHMKLVIDYADQLFHQDSIEQFLRAYLQVLNALVTAPEQRLSSLSACLPQARTTTVAAVPPTSDTLMSPPADLGQRARPSKALLLRVLTEGMQDILGRKIRTDVSMFEQGGHSMNLIAYQIYLEQALGFEVDIGILIGYPTIDLLVDYLFDTVNEGNG
ncbi:MAG: amino acid adenylation domain-containing protein [Neisseriaceae bacterium]|nr:amino acid adenylation domain-containing protein [Neisseriaceae bacterium]